MPSPNKSQKDTPQPVAPPTVVPSASSTEVITAPAVEPVPAVVTPHANPFSVLFGQPVYVNEPKKKAFVYKNRDGSTTESTGLASVTFPDYGASIPGLEGVTFGMSRVTKRVTGNNTVLALQLPSIAVGPTRKPVLNLKNAPKQTRVAFAAWQKSITDGYKAFRAAFIKSGGKDELADESIAATAAEVTADELEELGI